MPFKCQGYPVSLWHLTCNLEKCYLLRSSFGMYNLERQLRYLQLLTRHCPCNLLLQPTSPKHEYRGKLWGHPVTSSMMSSPWEKSFLGIIWDVFFIYLRSNWSCVWYFKISKMDAILSSRQTFLPEVEYTRKMAINISDILSFWSTL